MSVTRYQGSKVSNRVMGVSRETGRLVISHQTSAKSGFVGRIDARFNPNRLNFSTASTVKSRVNASPTVDKPGVEQTTFEFQATTLSVSLLFDTSEAEGKEANVLEHTTKVVALMRAMPKDSRPPLCQLWWGQYLLLQGYLTSLSQEFSLFSPDGTPVRATMNCTFTESGTYEHKLATASSSAGLRLYLVMLGETLQSISTKVYGTSNRWREIALFNGISNPRTVFPGRILLIPR